MALHNKMMIGTKNPQRTSLYFEKSLTALDQKLNCCLYVSPFGETPETSKLCFCFWPKYRLVHPENNLLYCSKQHLQNESIQRTFYFILRSTTSKEQGTKRFLLCASIAECKKGTRQRSFLAETSLGSPRKIFNFIFKNNI